jgi:hypothetical protein
MPWILAVSVVPNVQTKSGFFSVIFCRKASPFVLLCANVMSRIFPCPIDLLHGLKASNKSVFACITFVIHLLFFCFYSQIFSATIDRMLLRFRSHTRLKHQSR